MLRITALAFLAFVSIAPAHAQVIEGTASVIDGDTIDMTGTRVRLAYIDAPEAKQLCVKEEAEWACGTDATAELASLIDGGIAESSRKRTLSPKG